MTIAFVQGTSGASAVPATSVSKAYAANNGGGNTLVAAVLWDDVTTGNVTVTDSQGNAWVRTIATFTIGTSSFSIWRMVGCAAGANTVTATWGLASTFPVLLIAEYSGVSTFSVSAFNTGTGSPGSVTFTPGAAGETSVAFFGTPVTVAAAIAPYTQRVQESAVSGILLEDRIGAPAGVQVATATIPNTGPCCCTLQQWLGAVMTFAPAAAAATSNALFFGSNL